MEKFNAWFVSQVSDYFILLNVSRNTNQTMVVSLYKVSDDEIKEKMLATGFFALLQTNKNAQLVSFSLFSFSLIFRYSLIWFLCQVIKKVRIVQALHQQRRRKNRKKVAGWGNDESVFLLACAP
jgi:hypothetical protein